MAALTLIRYIIICTNVEIFQNKNSSFPRTQTFLLKENSKIFFEIQTKLFLPSFPLFLYYYYYYFFFFFLPCFLPSLLSGFLSPCLYTDKGFSTKSVHKCNTYGDIRLVPKAQKKESPYGQLRFLE